MKNNVEISRRKITKSAAWSAPVLATTLAAPNASASTTGCSAVMTQGALITSEYIPEAVTWRSLAGARYGVPLSFQISKNGTPLSQETNFFWWAETGADTNCATTVTGNRSVLQTIMCYTDDETDLVTDATGTYNFNHMRWFITSDGSVISDPSFGSGTGTLNVSVMNGPCSGALLPITYSVTAGGNTPTTKDITITTPAYGYSGCQGSAGNYTCLREVQWTFTKNGTPDGTVLFSNATGTGQIVKSNGTPLPSINASDIPTGTSPTPANYLFQSWPQTTNTPDFTIPGEAIAKWQPATL